MDQNEEVQFFSSIRYATSSKIDPLSSKMFLEARNTILEDIFPGNAHRW